MSLTVGSLFSGIGGLDLGLERAGMKVLWQVEKDEYARRVLKKHWPEVPCYSDVRDVHGRKPEPHERDAFRHLAFVEPVDLICGGFPCQDISIAGKGAGIKEGTRSGLWIEFARIVREIRPRYVLVENVPALRSRGLNRVLGDLAACGYDCEWDGISAFAVGAPHRRDRLFVVAYAQREFLREQPGRGSGPNRASEALTGQHGEERTVADADRQGLAVRIFESAREELTSFERGGPQGNAWTVEPDVGGTLDGFPRGLDGVGLAVPRVATGVPSRVDRLRCLGNAVVPQVAEFVGRSVLAFDEARHG